MLDEMGVWREDGIDGELRSRQLDLRLAKTCAFRHPCGSALPVAGHLGNHSARADGLDWGQHCNTTSPPPPPASIPVTPPLSLAAPLTRPAAIHYMPSGGRNHAECIEPTCFGDWGRPTAERD